MRFHLTDPEFCWRGLSVHKALATRPTHLERLRVQKGAKSTAVCEAVWSETNPLGYPRSSNSLLGRARVEILGPEAATGQKVPP